MATVVNVPTTTITNTVSAVQTVMIGTSNQM